MHDRTCAALRLGSTLAIALSASAPLGAQPAFPGAVGYGQDATGWRGGEIIAVTTLDDQGPGSLRSCAEAEGPRVCIFQVAGTITVSQPIRVRSKVYIAGQTAPGDGIQIRLDGSTHTPLVVKNAEDVVVRFLKSRPGPSVEPSAWISAVTVENSRRVYLDHLSMAFASDQTFTVHASSDLTADITLANSLLAYSLDHSTHPDGRHSKGALICSIDAPATGCGRITLWRNLFAHHRDRNPDVNGTDTGPIEIVNNVFYNPISQFGEYYNLAGETSIVHVGNITMPGPSTIESTPPAAEIFLLGGDNPIEITAHDNLAYANPPCKDNATGAVLGSQAQLLATDRIKASPGLPVLPAADLLEVVLAAAGDVLHRDSLDDLAIRSVRACAGRVIDHPDEVGGWPELDHSEVTQDTDSDGLPDDWEQMQAALDPHRADDPWAVDSESGLSWIETYLSKLAGDI